MFILRNSVPSASPAVLTYVCLSHSPSSRNEGKILWWTMTSWFAFPGYDYRNVSRAPIPTRYKVESFRFYLKLKTTFVKYDAQRNTANQHPSCIQITARLDTATSFITAARGHTRDTFVASFLTTHLKAFFQRRIHYRDRSQSQGRRQDRWPRLSLWGSVTPRRRRRLRRATKQPPAAPTLCTESYQSRQTPRWRRQEGKVHTTRTAAEDEPSGMESWRQTCNRRGKRCRRWCGLQAEGFTARPGNK